MACGEMCFLYLQLPCGRCSRALLIPVIGVKAERLLVYVNPPVVLLMLLPPTELCLCTVTLTVPKGRMVTAPRTVAMEI